MNLENSWNRIAEWYRKNVPLKEFRLAPGASEEQIVVLENVLGVRLPDDMRESYLLHDGTDGTTLVHYSEFLSLKEIETNWRANDEWQRDDNWGQEDDYIPGDIDPTAEDAIKPIWWNALRIPVTDISGADSNFIDLDPAEGGKRGQIISFSHEIGPMRVLAPSFSEWIEGIADGLEAGKFVYDEQIDMVVPPGYYDE